MVELRKRPAPKETPAPAAKRSASKPRTTAKAKTIVEKAKEIVTGESSTAATTTEAEVAKDAKEAPEASSTAVDAAPQTEETPATAAATSATPGDAATTPLSATSTGKTLPDAALQTPTLLHDGTRSTLASLLSSSQTGIVIFTYPKASTPGCTTQACLFRDNYDDIRAKGYDVYGLSNDSEKANTGFKTKQNLQYAMLCDPDAKITGVLGMKKPGNAKGTLRGVVVLSKEAKVVVWFQGGPPKTLEAAKEGLGL